MWYEVPKTKPAPYKRPKPIFPWEREREPQKPTRVFAEDLPPEPTPTAPSAPSEEPETTASSSVSSADDSKYNKTRFLQPEAPDEPWLAFSQSANAWDTVPGIDNYIRAFMGAQARRANPQPLPLEKVNEELMSPGSKERQESLILTDFPSALERPSLPVTPAPIRRPTFWGEERDEAGNLPAAEGVPDQTEWVCPQCGFSSASLSSFRATPQPQQLTSSSTRHSSSSHFSTATTLAHALESLAAPASLDTHSESMEVKLDAGAVPATTAAVDYALSATSKPHLPPPRASTAADGGDHSATNAAILAL